MNNRRVKGMCCKPRAGWLNIDFYVQGKAYL
jgi:hypothetical protein